MGNITIVIDGWHFLVICLTAFLWLFFSVLNELLSLYQRYLEWRLRKLKEK
jgi:hypothetical protein